MLIFLILQIPYLQNRPERGGGVKYVLKEVLTKIVVERYRPDKTGSSNLETDLVFSLISFEVSNTISNTVVTG